MQFDIFKPENRNHPLMLSALTEILVRLRDLLWKSEKLAKRVSFQDDVIIRGKVTDVTDLVVLVRDAVCHINSNEHDHDQIKARVSFNVIFGKGRLLHSGPLRVESSYEDELRSFLGRTVCIYTAILFVAFEEAQDNLLPYLQTRSI